MYRRCTRRVALLVPLAIASIACEDTLADDCSRCTITLTATATLRATDDRVTLVRQSRPVVDGQGRFVVAPLAEPGQIAVFDGSGRFLRVVGRAGSGPGEFRSIERLAVGPGDSVLVFDRASARMSVLAPTLDVARAVHVSALVFDAAPLGTRTLIMAALVQARGRLDYPYHVIADTGIAESFGATDETRQRDAAFAGIRSLAPARDGGLWTAHLNRYQIDRLDSVGVLRPVVQREVPWFPAWTKSEGAPPWLIRPNPKLTAIREDDRGRLWTFILVPHPRWKAIVPPLRHGREGPIALPELNAIDEILERVIEVIDPKTGRVLASRRVLGSYVGFAGNDMIYRHRETDDGEIEITISRLALADSSRK